MHSVNAILLQLPNVNKLDAVRWAVVALIREQLHRRRDGLDEWEALHFANAITMLAMNVNALHQPTTNPQNRIDCARIHALKNHTAQMALTRENGFHH